MKNDIIAFLLENIQRLKQKSPAFLRVWGRINIALIFFGGIPTALNWIQNEFKDVVDFSSILPTDTPWLLVLLKVCTILGFWGKLMTALSVQSNHEIIEDNGTLIQKPCEDLPYTKKKEGYKLVELKQVNN